MTLYSDPPDLRDFRYDKPTLLVCWWVTAFCTIIILLRLGGRFVRTERLFVEDKTAALALIPLYLRMACVHVILLYGTNNAQFDGVALSDDDLRRRATGSGLVLASRLFYAATLWILKSAILEFFKRLTSATWSRSSETTLLLIRCTLIVSFIAVLISDLAECQPFSHYWQVVPDPGGQCRQGYAQLLTMAICNIITDLLLVLFPVPIIIRSSMTIKRKTQLVLLFSLSLAVVVVTLYRVPHVIWDHGRQQTRSLLASIELLFAVVAANALVLGSFVRDRGVKKRKYRYESTAGDSIDHSSANRSRRPTINRQWGSDEDLVRGLGMAVDPELREETFNPPTSAGPAPIIDVAQEMSNWQFPEAQRGSATRSDDPLLLGEQLATSRSNSTATPRKVSFFDNAASTSDDGGGGSGSGGRRDSHVSHVDPLSPRGLPSPTVPASQNGMRRGSTAFLQDIGGLLSPLSSPKSPKSPRTRSRGGTELETIPQARSGSIPYMHPGGKPDPELLDPGGLLGPKRS